MVYLASKDAANASVARSNNARECISEKRVAVGMVLCKL